jgi:hypothetical protein
MDLVALLFLHIQFAFTISLNIILPPSPSGWRRRSLFLRRFVLTTARPAYDLPFGFWPP